MIKHIPTRSIMFSSIILILILAGCNLPQATQPSPKSQISTQASSLLTASAISISRTPPAVLQTPQPSQVGTSTPVLSPTTPVASATQNPTATNTNTTQPTATGTKPPTTFTPSKQPSPTPPAEDPKQTLGNPTWKETFTSGKSFYQFKDDNTEVKVENDALVLTSFKASGWHGWSLTHTIKPLNFYVEGTFKTKTCSGNDAYGLVFRAPSDQEGYFASLTCDGRFKVHQWDGSKTIEIIPLTFSAAIKPGSNQVNRFGVKAAGSTLTLFANGYKLKEFNDSRYPNEGYIGAFIAAVKTSGFIVELDEIAYWKLP